MNSETGVSSGALALMNSPSGLTGMTRLDSLASAGIAGIDFLGAAGAGACLVASLALTDAFTMPGIDY